MTKSNEMTDAEARNVAIKYAIITFAVCGLFLGGMFVGAKGTYQERQLCAYSTGYLDAEMQYLHTTNLTAMEGAGQIWGNSTRTAFLGYLACDDIGIDGGTKP